MASRCEYEPLSIEAEGQHTKVAVLSDDKFCGKETEFNTIDRPNQLLRLATFLYDPAMKLSEQTTKGGATGRCASVGFVCHDY